MGTKTIMNLIISQERSLNKAEGFINTYKADCVLIVDRLPDQGKKEYIHLASSVLVIPDFDFQSITSAVPVCSNIWCVSENLLPLIARLDAHYAINNLSLSTATILSDKLKFDNLCRAAGLGEFVPDSIIPTTIDELLAFGDRKIIVKSNIGSGGAVFFPGDDQNNPVIEFRVWDNPSALLSHLRVCNLIDYFFNINTKQGITKDGYCNREARFMVQEFCEPAIPCVVTTGFVRNGKVEITLLGRMSKAPDRFDHNKGVIGNHTPVAALTRDAAVWTIFRDDLDPNILETIQGFLQRLIDALQIKTLFFSGPDFHIDQHGRIKVIDFNPRISGWLNLINKNMNYSLITDIIDNRYYHFSILDTLFLWGCAVLRPGTIKSIGDISSIQKYLNTENTALVPNTIIPERINLQNKNFNVNVTVSAKSEKDLHDIYLHVTQVLQDAIEYY